MHHYFLLSGKQNFLRGPPLHHINLPFCYWGYMWSHSPIPQLQRRLEKWEQDCRDWLTGTNSPHPHCHPHQNKGSENVEDGKSGYLVDSNMCYAVFWYIRLCLSLIKLLTIWCHTMSCSSLYLQFLTQLCGSLSAKHEYLSGFNASHIWNSSFKRLSSFILSFYISHMIWKSVPHC